MKRYLLHTASVLFLLFISIQTRGQESLKVCVECLSCDMDFLKREITWVEYVRDLSQSDVYIWSVDQQNGAGGRQYTIHFDGQGEYDQISFDLDCFTTSAQTQLEVQTAIIQLIKSGIMPFLTQKGGIADFSISVNNGNEMIPKLEFDPWKKWVFDLGLNVGYEMESNQKDMDLEGNFRARHTSEQWRVRSEIEYDYKHREVTQEHIDFIHTNDRINMEGSVVRSLTDHWSAGTFLEADKNSSRNLQFSFRWNAALEWNLYPYAESHQKEFTIAYYLGPVFMNYIEETIFDKRGERMIGHQISINYQLNKAWGSLDARLNGFQYINDPTKNRITFDAGARIRVTNGLSFRIYGEYQIIHDQIYLPKGSASLEDILLKRKSIATDFSLDLYVGVVYTFGSIYNSIVNTRL